MEEKEEQKQPEFAIKFNHEAKLKELLRNLTSIESQLCSEASKEFIKILKSDLGPEILRVYVQTSYKLIEISQAWEFRKGKPGFLNILNLVAAIMKHWKDNAVADGGVGIVRALDKFARALIEEKMEHLYKELNSKDAKRQNAVLLLLASIVRRNSHLAWEVAKVFDFKLACFPKLAEVRLRAQKKFVEGRKKSYSTRKAFVSFAMAFLEVGNPRLLRGVLQEKEMYSGVLRGLGKDDDETVVYVLSNLRDRVLVPESSVPVGLRSVLFGSVTLEQLVSISGRDNFGDAANLAHMVLVMVCTNPVNGLMPDLERQPTPLRGNPKRLLGLMKKLKATELAYHKDLLLAIVRGRPSFGSAYLDEFPYSLEDLSSDNWSVAVSLAADVISSVSDGLSSGAVDKLPSLESQYVENILKCIGPRPFTRLVINKGLLHSDSLLKHGTLKLVLEALKLLCYLMRTVDRTSHPNNQMKHSWEALKADIQNRARIVLPDPQVLLSLLSPLNSHFKNLESTIKRKAEIVSEHDINVSKRLKASAANEDLDILISGVDASEEDLSEDGGGADSGGEQQMDSEADIVEQIRELWGLHQSSMKHDDLNDGDTYFYSKLLDSLQMYYCTLPMAMEGSFDLFKFLPNNPLVLPTILQQSLLKLLNEYVSQFSKDVTHFRTPPQMYKHLHPFVILLLCSPIRQIKEQAYNLAKGAMLSTGAFDNNMKEICVWFFFIPGYSRNHVYVDKQELEIIQKLSSVIVSFLCDAVSTIGNNLFKYMEFLKNYIHDSEGGTDLSPEVSPFIICILEKCLRLVSSESGSFEIPQKSLISLYVCNTIKNILDMQANAGPLSYIINLILSEKLEHFRSRVDILELAGCPCEWRPLEALLHFARDIFHQQCYKIYSNVEEVMQSNNSFINTLSNIKEVLQCEYDIGLAGLTVGFSFSLMCTRHVDLLQNFPLVLSISSNLREVPFSVLSSIFFLESSYLTILSKLWPEMFFSALDTGIHCKEDNEEASYKFDLDSTESASVAFARYLKSTPFCVLFSSIAQSGGLHLFEQSMLLKLLFEKVSEQPCDHLISSLCNVLFWINHASLCYRVNSLAELEMLSEICFKLAEHLLKKVLVENRDNFNLVDEMAPPLYYAVEVVEIIFNHPAVTTSLSCPLSSYKELSDSVFGESQENLLELAKQGVHRMDQYILDLIRTAAELLFPVCDDQMSEQLINGRKRISRAFKQLEQKLFLVFKNKFDACIQEMDFKPLVPTFYALHTFIHFISPFELLELVNWLLCRIDFDIAVNLSSKRIALFVALHLASCFLDSFSSYLAQPHSETKLYSLLGSTDETHVDVLLLERIFFHLLEISCHFNADIADACLLKAVKVLKVHKVSQDTHLPSIMVLSRVMTSTPANIISYCLCGINSIKAELLYLIAGMSPLHLSIFGCMLSDRLNKSLLPDQNGTQETCKYCFSDDELVMLLPTVLLYLNSVISKFSRQLCKPLEGIILVYARVLLGGFSKWKIFVSGTSLEIGLDEPLTATTEEFLSLFSDSLLGKAILMVRDHLALKDGMMTLESRLNLFHSVCPSGANDVFDYSHGETGLDSLKQPLDFVNSAVAKINFCKILLYSDNCRSLFQLDNGVEKVTPSQVTSDLEKSRIGFLRMLINSWISIIKKSSEDIDYSGDINSQNISLIRFLEVFAIRNILELVKEMHDCLIKLDSLPFIEHLVKSFLLYRFGDPVTVKMLRTILTSLSDGKFSCASLIQLLLAHSQFAQTFNLACQTLVSTQFGLVFTPMQSILRAFVVRRTALDTLDCKSDKLTSQQRLNLLELVKLVRVLFHTYAQQREANFGEDIGINPRELIYLLLSSYGATCSEIDLEIYNLMLEIESSDKSAGTLAQMDYLWGIAFLRVRKDWELGKDMQSVDPEKIEVFEERLRVKFRENLPVDPKLCAQTVLYFPYDRFTNGRTPQKQEKDSSAVMYEARSTTAKLQIYDPVFILHFAINCLSMGYVEPIEFASLGLLAVTFVSISSLDDDVRKLGYETLSKFRSALEKCQKKKDVAQLRLLVSYLQNGIEEPWQRIPSIIAAFIAEASLVLLDPSHDNYSTISKYLMNSASINLKAIPLFQNFFWSSSINFRADRLWMLRLLCIGLNTEDDAQTYIKNSIFEILMSFYSSPLSDNDSKELILQIVKKAVQLHKAVWFLVEHCGLILWLSSIVSSLCGSECQDQKEFTLKQLPVILEVINYITSPRNITEWLQKHAMEQLSELSAHLYKLLVGGAHFIKEESILCNSILQILTLVMKISQKRKIYQPHFTLSEEGLYQLYEAVEVCFKTNCNSSTVFGLNAILMCTPPATIVQMDQDKLLKFMRWAITTAMQSASMKVLQPEDSVHHLATVSGEKPSGESLVPKLLRWLTASAILGKISHKLGNLNNDCFLERPSLGTLQSLLEWGEKGFGESAGYGCEDVLAASIFYLLQQLGFRHQLLPSAVAALCLLLLSDSPSELEFLVGLGISLPSLCSKIHCPAEANPAWRWSYYQPWRDLAVELTDVEKLDEIHACEMLVMVASNILLRKSGCSHFFELKDVDKLHVHDWERSMIHPAE